MTVKIKRIDGGQIPEFKHSDDACADCHARIEEGKVYVKPGERTLVPLGFALGLEKGWEAVIRPRSGLTSKGIDIGIGTVDAGYRSEVKACVINNSKDEFRIADGDRICQMAIREIPQISFEETDSLDETERGADGFGSTGV